MVLATDPTKTNTAEQPKVSEKQSLVPDELDTGHLSDARRFAGVADPNNHVRRRVHRAGLCPSPSCDMSK